MTKGYNHYTVDPDEFFEKIMDGSEAPNSEDEGAISHTLSENYDKGDLSRTSEYYKHGVKRVSR